MRAVSPRTENPGRGRTTVDGGRASTTWFKTPRLNGPLCIRPLGVQERKYISQVRTDDIFGGGWAVLHRFECPPSLLGLVVFTIFSDWQPD